jgi:ribosomal protein S18 acetylase RimI-like enzyme
MIVVYGAVFEAHIREIFVDSSYRCLGMGRETLEYFTATINGNVSLGVAKSNTHVKRLYQE